MTTSRYLAGLLVVVATVVPHALVGWAVQRVLPVRTAAEHLLAGAVAAVASLLVVGEILGSVGGFRPVPLLVAGWAVAAGALLARRRAAGEECARPVAGIPAPASPPWLGPVAVVAAGGAVVRWLAPTLVLLQRATREVDSLTYHLPFAVAFARTGWVTRYHHVYPDPVHLFYPASGELLQAVALSAMGRDVLVPVVNLGWLLLLLLAGWCAGRPDGVPGTTLLVATWLATIPLVLTTNATSALVDVATLAALVAGVALWRTADGDGRWLATSGLALGLAVSLKLTAAPVVAAFMVVAALLATGRRHRAALVLLGSAVVPGAVWFLRNLVRTGNPLPHLALPLLPSPELPVLDRFGRTVAHYLGDGPVWRSTFWPGIQSFFGVGGALAAAALVVALPAIARSGRRAVAVAVAGLVGVAGYLVSPAGAWGLEGDPVQPLFEANLRYLLPALAVLGVAAAWATAGRPVVGALVGVALAGAVAGNLLHRTGFEVDERRYATAGAVLALVLAAALLARTRPGGTRVAALAGAAALVVVAVVAGPDAARERLRDADTYATGTAEGQVFAWAAAVRPARLAIYGFDIQHPLAGPAGENEVDYLGVTEPHGGFRTPRTCPELVAAIGGADADYVLLGPAEPYGEAAPLVAWAAGLDGFELVLRAPPFAAYRVPDQVTARGCPAG